MSAGEFTVDRVVSTEADDVLDKAWYGKKTGFRRNIMRMQPAMTRIPAPSPGIRPIFIEAVPAPGRWISGYHAPMTSITQEIVRTQFTILERASTNMSAALIAKHQESRSGKAGYGA